jgi:hypothetical protein
MQLDIIRPSLFTAQASLRNSMPDTNQGTKRVAPAQTAAIRRW